MDIEFTILDTILSQMSERDQRVIRTLREGAPSYSDTCAIRSITARAKRVDQSVEEHLFSFYHLCECGCGLYVKLSSRYLPNHMWNVQANRQAQKDAYTPERLEKYKQDNLGKKNPIASNEQARAKMSESGKTKIFTEEHRKNISEKTKDNAKHREGVVQSWTPERRAKHSLKMKEVVTGRKDSPETAQKKSDMWTDEMKEEAGVRAASRLQQGKQKVTLTVPHLQLKQLLFANSIETVAEKRFGRYSVDEYDFRTHTAYEADGDAFHGPNSLFGDTTEADAKRDQYLLENYNLKVIHFTETQLEAIAKDKFVFRF
jgi:hypothetical protein